MLDTKLYINGLNGKAPLVHRVTEHDNRLVTKCGKTVSFGPHSAMLNYDQALKLGGKCGDCYDPRP